MARTMSDEQERHIRLRPPRNGPTRPLLRELDAERAEHEETKAELHDAHARDGNRLGKQGMFGTLAVRDAEIAALKARLALAEAVCESCEYLEGEVTFDYDKLEAWRAAK